jgi:hypothetical protein
VARTNAPATANFRKLRESGNIAGISSSSSRSV